jgi:hypothetical protein
MPEQPTICAILLTADRPEYARRAVAAFRAQTYPAKRLLILDSGVTQLGFDSVSTARGEFYVRGERGPILPTIGELRNMANGIRHFEEPDIFVHFDDDDWSHPNRIAEQVALLQSSGADVVGYRECLFWRERQPIENLDAKFGIERRTNFAIPGEAWLYSNPDPRYCLGTSLCYWRKTWERKPFEATSQGEDVRFCTGLKCVGVPTGPMLGKLTGLSNVKPSKDAAPRMIARIHSGNTSTVYRAELMAAIERQGGEWKRSPEWDSYCRGVME